MHNVIPWSNKLDLEVFYAKAHERRFVNNSSEKALVNCFDNEREKQVWILYFKGVPVGSVAAHSFDDVMGANSYRIAARTCVFTDHLEGAYGTALRTISVVTEHQNPTAQFLIPTCINWCPKGSALYITSNNNDAGSQRRVHTIFGPTLESQGTMKRIKDVYYRNTNQTVWQFFPDVFYEQINSYPRWT